MGECCDRKTSSFCSCLLALFVFFPAILFWLIVRPQNIDISITDASLLEFQYFNTSKTLNYHLVFNITLQNPNKRAGMYYDRLNVIALYGKKEFGNVSLHPLYQRHDNTTSLKAVMRERHVGVDFEEKEISKYKSEGSDGIYCIDLKLPLKVRAKYGSIKPKFKTNRTCYLRLVLNPNATFKYSAPCGSIDIFRLKLSFAIGPFDLQIS